jgi:hypothetical protein
VAVLHRPIKEDDRVAGGTSWGLGKQAASGATDGRETGYCDAAKENLVEFTSQLPLATVVPGVVPLASIFSGSAVKTVQFNTILNEPPIIIIKMRANTRSPESVPRVNPHLRYEQPKRHSPKIISNPIVPVCASPYDQDHAYTHTVYNHIYC